MRWLRRGRSQPITNTTVLLLVDRASYGFGFRPGRFSIFVEPLTQGVICDPQIEEQGGQDGMATRNLLKMRGLRNAQKMGHARP